MVAIQVRIRILKIGFQVRFKVSKLVFQVSKIEFQVSNHGFKLKLQSRVFKSKLRYQSMVSSKS